MRLLTTITRIDHLAFYWLMRQQHQRCLRTFSRLLSFSGDGYLYAVTGLVLLLTGKDSHRDLFIALASVFLLERTLYWVLKIASSATDRHRPYPDSKASSNPPTSSAFPRAIFLPHS